MIQFTPPVPLLEGCSRAVPWTKSRLPRHHTRDPLDFLQCAANPPPKPLITSQKLPHSRDKFGHSGFIQSNQHVFMSPPEPTKLLSPNERDMCRDAALKAASLVANQLKLPIRVRHAWIAEAVLKATGIPMQNDRLINATDGLKSTDYLNDGDCEDRCSNLKRSKLDHLNDGEDRFYSSGSGDDDEDDEDECEEDEYDEYDEDEEFENKDSVGAIQLLFLSPWKKAIIYNQIKQFL